MCSATKLRKEAVVEKLVGGENLHITAFRIIPDSQNKSGIQINIRMMRYDTVIIRTICAFSG